MPGDTIRHIFSLEGGGKGRQAFATCDSTSPCHFTARSLGILSAFYLILMALASGVAVPGGLFMPSIMVSLSTCCVREVVDARVSHALIYGKPNAIMP